MFLLIGQLAGRPAPLAWSRAAFDGSRAATVAAAAGLATSLLGPAWRISGAPRLGSARCFSRGTGWGSGSEGNRLGWSQRSSRIRRRVRDLKRYATTTHGTALEGGLSIQGCGRLPHLGGRDAACSMRHLALWYPTACHDQQKLPTHSFIATTACYLAQLRISLVTPRSHCSRDTRLPRPEPHGLASLSNPPTPPRNRPDNLPRRPTELS